MAVTGQPDEQQGDPVVAAIERVLRTEREGVATLRKSEEAAQRQVADARAQAIALSRRADRCIARLHANYLQKIDREIAALKAAAQASGAGAAKRYDRATLETAARRVAAKLTGGP